MRDDPDFNIRFVSIIENNLMLYDHTISDYCNKYAVDRTWENVAKQLSESDNVGFVIKPLSGIHTKNECFVESEETIFTNLEPVPLSTYGYGDLSFTFDSTPIVCPSTSKSNPEVQV
ncbi:uncharacterized protein LOC112681430 isoform X2 [Sipha flava]|uniref:Uncharacterized protein LOC112681430 isoform X2 n=1 Tax=Sipha flava TaxID=143950 RepID=A0A8B8F9F1_9HEMI|nr:uncharacterized protein LOC112681430 isoform X2 [Sipha flava]